MRARQAQLEKQIARSIDLQQQKVNPYQVRPIESLSPTNGIDEYNIIA